MAKPQVLLICNKFIALCYVGMAMLVASHAVTGEVSLMGSSVLVTVLACLAFGHFYLKSCALKASAALSGAVNLLAIPYVFSIYEQQMLAPFQHRLSIFLCLTFFTFLMILNYHFCENRGHENRGQV